MLTSLWQKVELNYHYTHDYLRDHDYYDDYDYLCDHDYYDDYHNHHNANPDYKIVCVVTSLWQQVELYYHDYHDCDVYNDYHDYL